MIKAIAWDIDGTLVHSEPLHLLALQEVCRAHAVDISDLDDGHFIGVHIGDVWRELAPRFAPGVTFAEWSGQIEIAFSENRDRLVEVPGAFKTIERLAALGVRQVAVSNSNRRIVDTNLSAIGVADYMEFSLSLDDVCEGKPDPFPYRLACSLLRLKPEEVLAVEDSATGVASASAARVPVVHLRARLGQTMPPARPATGPADVLKLLAAQTDHHASVACHRRAAGAVQR